MQKERKRCLAGKRFALHNLVIFQVCNKSWVTLCNAVRLMKVTTVLENQIKMKNQMLKEKRRQFVSVRTNPASVAS